jgi:hypothetical protein
MSSRLTKIETWLTVRGRLAVGVAAMFLLSAAQSSDRAPAMGSAALSPTIYPRVATLHHDPQFILQAVARRMKITLLPGVPVPAVLLESRTPLLRLQAAAEREWGIRPSVFFSAYASAGNEIYLIDDAAMHKRRHGTLDDSLAHEFVHFLQAQYRKDALDTDWSESEAVAVQLWFRDEYMRIRLATGNAQPAPRHAKPPLSAP